MQLKYAEMLAIVAHENMKLGDNTHFAQLPILLILLI